MIKKISGAILTASLTIGLAACNNDTNDINDQTMNRVGMNTTDVRNGMTDIDHTGPLTEDYVDHDNNGDLNLFTGKLKNRLKNDDRISAYQTTLDSNKYPHTRAVLIQDAKYKFVKLNPSQVEQFKNQMSQYFQPNNQQQMQMEQQWQARQEQPAAPQQKQPAPQQTKPAPKPAAPKQQPAPQAPQQTPAKNNAGTTGNMSQFVQQVIDLTNQERSKKGLSALKADTQLNGVAQKKADDMEQNHYFSHTSPTYGSPFDMMRDFGVTYKAAGENIAQGQKTPQEVVTAWMNSEGHRANILSTKYTHIGVGFESAGNHWSQMFIGK